MAELLRVEHLTAGYGESVVLDDVSLALGEGESLALLGRNGVGKTTFFVTLMGLARHLASRAPLDRGEAMAWMGSANGKQFMSESGGRWRAAHVASGEEPALAKERSDRTIAFFRGEASPDIAHPGTGS